MPATETESNRAASEDLPRQEAFRRVRRHPDDPVDHVVLSFIADGTRTLAAINAASTDELTHGRIRTAFEKLEALGLLDVEWDRDGYTTSVRNGQVVTHQKSNRAELTERGRQYFSWCDCEPTPGRFDASEAARLHEQVEALQDRVDELEAAVDDQRERAETIAQRLQRLGQIVRRVTDRLGMQLDRRGDQ